MFAAADRFMQPRDIVLHALTGLTATDETHANSTVLFDLRERAWADELLDALDLDASLFPRRAGAVGGGGAAEPRPPPAWAWCPGAPS